jgi:hypothetical protein
VKQPVADDSKAKTREQAPAKPRSKGILSRIFGKKE